MDLKITGSAPGNAWRGEVTWNVVPGLPAVADTCDLHYEDEPAGLFRDTLRRLSKVVIIV